MLEFDGKQLNQLDTQVHELKKLTGLIFSSSFQIFFTRSGSLYGEILNVLIYYSLVTTGKFMFAI